MFPIIHKNPQHLQKSEGPITIAVMHLDVSSLYTNIPQEECITAIQAMLAIHRSEHHLPHNSYIVKLLKEILTNKYFDFNGDHYHQVSGTVMDTKFVPSCSNLFKTMFERQQVYTYPL